MTAGLQAHGVAAADGAARGAACRPVSILFAAFLGYNPIQHLARRRTRWPRCRRHNRAVITGRLVLPAPDLRPVPHRAARGVRVRDRRLPDRRGGVAHARRALRARRRGRAVPSRSQARPQRRSSMQVEWYGQSAFRLTRRRGDRVHRSVRRHDAGSPRRGMQFDYPAIDGVDGRPAARHARAPRPQRRRGDRRRARGAALDGRQARVADRRGRGRRVRARRGRGHRARARTRSSCSRSTACASRTSATSARPRCATSRPRRSARSTCCSCRSAAARRSAPSRRAAIADRLGAALGRADALPHAADRVPRDRRRVPRADAERASPRVGGLRHGGASGGVVSRGGAVGSVVSVYRSRSARRPPMVPRYASPSGPIAIPA